MTDLDAYHAYAAKHAFAPTLTPPADLCAATLPYVSANAKQTQSTKTRDLLRKHRAAQAGAPDLFALHPSPGQLAQVTGLPIAAAHEQLSAYRRARGLKPVPIKPERSLPAYEPPPPLDPDDPIADYHARVGPGNAIRFGDLRRTLKVSDNAARLAYHAWCRAHDEAPKTSPTGSGRPWQSYAIARLSEGYTPAEIAAALDLPTHCIEGLKVKDP